MSTTTTAPIRTNGTAHSTAPTTVRKILSAVPPIALNIASGLTFSADRARAGPA